jgi:hypothetical protein
LQERLRKAVVLLAVAELTPEVLKKWQATTEDCLTMAFGENSRNVRTVMRSGPAVQRSFRSGDPEGERYLLHHRRKTLTSQMTALEAAIEMLDIRAGLDEPSAQPSESVCDESVPDIFLSHVTRNQPLARAITDLLEAAFRLPRDSIRCTSVDGYKLDGGVNISATLRREVVGCKVLLALMSPEALESFYVSVEVGGRLFAERPKPLIPLTVPGAKLKPPLSEIRAFDIAAPAEILHFIEQLGRHLGLTPNSPASYHREVEALASLARHSSVAVAADAPNIQLQTPFKAPEQPGLSGELATLLRYFVHREDQGAPRLGVADVVRGTGWKASLAEQCLSELLERELVATSYFESGYRLTTTGRREALLVQQAAAPIEAAPSRWTP